MKGSKNDECSCCGIRGDKIDKKNIRKVGEYDSYNLNSLNRSPRKKTSRPIVLGNFLNI